MSDAYQQNPAPTNPVQGSSSNTDIVTALQGLIRQVTAGNAQLAAIVTALNGGSANGYTFATLPTSPAIGNVAYITDGAASLAPGDPAIGGGTATYLVWWNASQWTVVGI